MQEAAGRLPSKASSTRHRRTDGGSARADRRFYAQVDEAQAPGQCRDLRSARAARARAARATRVQEAHFFAKTCAEKSPICNTTTRQITDALAQSEQNLTQLRADLSVSEDETAQQQLQAAVCRRAKRLRAGAGGAQYAWKTPRSTCKNSEQERLACEHKLNPLREKLNELTLREQEARLHFRAMVRAVAGCGRTSVAALVWTAQITSRMLAKRVEPPECGDRGAGCGESCGAGRVAGRDRAQGLSGCASQDLNEAMATLEDAIRRIDKESRELLMDTYNRVNGHLSEMFPVLFAGGEARLVLTGEEILDSGVQVMAQPPGKKNSSIHLLSGGEKGLTAIALVFSLFQLNPHRSACWTRWTRRWTIPTPSGCVR